MARYFIIFQYDGTLYHGWQRQPNAVTVQSAMEKAMSLLLSTAVELVGAGRTDTGVHARQMVAHFDFTNPLDTSQLAYKLNRVLPRDIVVRTISQVADDMHARFSAKSRTYHYYVHTRKDAFLRSYSCLITYPLDFDLMNHAAAILMEYQDFGAFCKSHTDVKTTLCQITEARWVKIVNPARPDIDEGSYYFRITANRFLRNMVRAVVGTLIEVGRGRLSLSDFRSVIEGRNRSDAGESMPANALFLEKIDY